MKNQISQTSYSIANWDEKLRAFFAILFAMSVIFVPTAKGQFTGSENFSGPLSQSKWFPFTEGAGSISLSNQEFNFTSSVSSGEHEAGLAWTDNSVKFSENWEFQLDVKNALSVANSSRYAAVGIYVANANDERDLAYLEFYSSFFDDLGRAVHGFTAGLKSNGADQHEGDTFELPFEIGALRVRFNRSEGSLSFYYHTGPTDDGYFWQFLAKYGLNGNGGTEANTNWQMPSGAEFEVGLYGSATGTRSNVGQLTADNFTADGTTLGVHQVDFEFEAAVNAAGDSVALSWFSFEGLEYVVQVSDDLVNWSDLTIALGTGRYAGLSVPLTASEKPSFYRIYSQIP